VTAFESQPTLPNGASEPDRPENGRITVSMRGDTARSEKESPASPWLYIAGALVTLSALYAVNFGLEDAGFAMLTYVLATAGYCTSYFLRTRGVSLRGLQVPLLTLLGFFFLLSLLFGQSANTPESPSRNLQIALTWVAILHAYTLSNNAAVLFACVPGMTLIALVSTSTTELEAQNAFLVFFSAATFLLIHENYLRTQARPITESDNHSVFKTPPKQSVLFGSQFALAAGCFLGAIILARLTVIPMQFVGERLFPKNTLMAIRDTIRSATPAALYSNERTNYEVATGPVSASDSPIMEVHSDQPLYWRGGTFDTYTGHGFKNSTDLEPLALQDSSPQADKQNVGTFIDPNKGALGHFQLLPDQLDLPEIEMTDHTLVRQHIKMLTGNIMQIYGAERVKELVSPVLSIRSDNVGSLTPVVPLQANTEYDVVSVVPSASPSVLRAAPAAPLPPEIAKTYLRIRTARSGENPVLAQLAAEWTRDAKTNYDKVLAIQRNIADRCSYNLNTPAAPRDQDVVEYFLTESKQGYCDSFGAAMTVMCRYAGIPARMALGFLPGDETATHTYIVKDKHRHIWTEVFFPTVGWVTFDATSGAADTTTRTDSTQKKSGSLLAWLGKQGIGPKIIEVILAVLLIYLVKTELIDRIKPRTRELRPVVAARPANNVAVLRAYSAANKMFDRRGLTRAANMTTAEFDTLINVKIADAGIGSAWTELTELHDRYYYGAETASVQEVQRAEAALGRFQEALRQFKGDPAKAPQGASA
jgi:hypothetical protein